MNSTCTRRSVLEAGLCIAGAGLSPFAFAQRGPLHMVVGYPPGGATDVIARVIARAMHGYDAVVVENRVGAGGRIAIEAVMRAKADGQTAIVTPDFPLTVFPHIYRKLNYDPVKDLAPVAGCGVSEFALSVGPAVPAGIRTLAEYLRWAAQEPQQAMYASPSPGSTPHFTGVMLAAASKVPLTPVAYKGGSQSMQDVLGGQVPASFNPVAEVLPHLDGGKLRVLATSGSERSPFLPKVPTLGEVGYPVVVKSWIGVFAPAATPEPVLAQLERSIQESLKTAAVADSFAKFGVAVSFLPRQRLATVLREGLQCWEGVVRSSGFKVEE